MNNRCTINKCKNEVEFLFCRIQDRAIVNEAEYCRTHGNNFLREYEKQSFVGKSRFFTKTGSPVFEVELLAIDQVSDESLICCRETNGTRRFDFSTGPYEAYSLRRHLQKQPSPRPLTHTAMSELVKIMGGTINYIEIVEHVREHNYYLTEVNISRNHKQYFADFRPSDAIVLAVTDDVPILVSEDLLPVSGS